MERAWGVQAAILAGLHSGVTQAVNVSYYVVVNIVITNFYSVSNRAGVQAKSKKHPAGLAVTRAGL